MRSRLADAQIKEFIAGMSSATIDEIAVAIRQRGFSIGNDRLIRLSRAVFRETSGADGEIIEENVRLAMRSQGQLDKNRVANKSFRDFARLSNAMEECGKEIISILKKYDFSQVTIQHEVGDEPAQGIIQLADLHLNELVRTATNTYDFPTASKRLKKYALRATEYLTMKGVKNVLVANTGDILNSDRRLDEYMNMATNRMNAAMLAVFLIEQFLLDLNEHFNVTYIQVSGNESRVKDEPGNTDIILTDNYDMLIYNILKHSMATAKGIVFQDGNIAEKVVSVSGQNVLVLHGENVGSDVIGSIQKIKGKYAQQGIPISFVVFGHVHTALVHNHFARSGSLVGANDYTDRGLQLTTGASQNVHVFYRGGDHDSLVINLNNTDGWQGYDIVEALESYNAKSEKKLHQQTVIHQIVV